MADDKPKLGGTFSAKPKPAPRLSPAERNAPPRTTKTAAMEKPPK